MKYIIIFSLLFSGCMLNYDCFNPCVCMNETETIQWIKSNISYEYDFLEYWKSPKETLRTMSGDCEDFVILFMYLMYENHNVKYDMAVVWNAPYKSFHAVCLTDDKRVLNIQGSSVFDYEDVKIINKYDFVMFTATTGGMKSYE